MLQEGLGYYPMPLSKPSIPQRILKHNYNCPIHRQQGLSKPSIPQRILKHLETNNLRRRCLVSKPSIPQRILKQPNQLRAFCLSDTFQTFDPPEDTETYSLRPSGCDGRTFQTFDPPEDTETSGVSVPEGKSVPFPNLRSPRGY